MLFTSTELGLEQVSFKSAVLRCLPADGGLFVPTAVNDLRQLFLYMDNSISYSDMASSISPALLGSEMNPIVADEIAKEAYSFSPKLLQLNDNLSLLELHNGPTGVFKDFGIAYCASLIEHLLGKGEQAVILTATTGSTGASIARAFKDKAHTLAVLLYPEGKIYGLNEADFVQNGGNILPIQVAGNFDDCQRLIQAAFNQKELVKRYSLTSANTINIGRLLPQSFYYLYAFIMLKESLHADLLFSVPSGNFGNLMAGLYAWKFGMPVNGFIAAMNTNNALGPFLTGKTYQGNEFVKPTISSAMDVGQPANFQRIKHFYTESPAVMKNMVVPKAINDRETRAAIVDAYRQFGAVIDPHTAVAYAAAQQVLAGDLEDGHIVVLSTGHPAKRAALIEELLGIRLEIPEHLQLTQRETQPVARIPVQLEALESLLAASSPAF